jgi:predicted metal-binding membrane protein
LWAALLTSALAAIGLFELQGALGDHKTGHAIALPWTVGHAISVFGLWALMMALMMAPASTPMIAAFDTVVATRYAGFAREFRITCLIAGYLAAWSAFSGGATAAQWCLEAAGAIVGESLHHPVLKALFWFIAGVYQLSPLKRACLHRCRYPLGFFLIRWREGLWDSFAMGWRQGLFCVGCCWALMLLLFVVGLTSLPGMAVLAGFALLEKTSISPQEWRRCGPERDGTIDTLDFS